MFMVSVKLCDLTLLLINFYLMPVSQIEFKYLKQNRPTFIHVDHLVGAMKECGIKEVQPVHITL